MFSSKAFLSDAALELFGGNLGVVVLLVSIIILFCVESYQNRGGSMRKALARQNLVFRWIVLLGLLFSVLLFGVYGPGYSASEFIYAAF